MKNTYITFLFSIVSIIVLCCACHKTGNLGSAEINHIIPETELTIEGLAEGTQKLSLSLTDSYSRMQELAASEDASEKGKKAAKKVSDKYGNRIKELSEIDYFSLTEEELRNYMSEISSLITAVREARDELTLH